MVEVTEDTVFLQNLRDELEAERDWRINEFTRMKMLFRRISENETIEYTNMYLKMTVPMLYAHWEGFCVASFKLFSEHINSMMLDSEKVTYNILTYANTDAYDKLKGKQKFIHKVEFSELFSKILFGKVVIKTRVNTKSNLNAKALKEIFDEFQLNYDSLELYSSDLTAFVNVRNAIAHGENSIVIDREKMLKYIDLVVELIDKVMLEQISFIEERRYLKNE